MAKQVFLVQALCLEIKQKCRWNNNRLYSPRARNRFNQVVEVKRFEGVFLCRKVC